MVCSSFKQCTTWWRKKKEKEVNKRMVCSSWEELGRVRGGRGPRMSSTLWVWLVWCTHCTAHNMYISCYTHTDTIINMYSMCCNIRQKEEHTVGVVHPWYVTHTHTHNNYIIDAYCTAHTVCVCGALMVRKVHTHNNCKRYIHGTAHVHNMHNGWTLSMQYTNTVCIHN